MLRRAQILLVSCESSDRLHLQKVFEASGSEVFCCSTLLEAESFLSGQHADVIFADLNFPDGNCRDLMVEIEHFQMRTPLIALDRKTERDSCAPAAKVPGIFHRLSLPASASQIEDVLQSALHASPANWIHIPLPAHSRRV